MVVPHFRRQLEIGAQERRAKFGDEFFGGIARVAPSLSAKVAVKTRGVTRPVDALVCQRRVVALRVAERLERRHPDMVVRYRIAGRIAAADDVDFGRREERLGAFDALDRIENRRIRPCVVVLRQSVDLLDIEDGVAFHEGDDRFGILAGLFVTLCARDGVGIDDERAVFSLADIAAKLKRLLEGHPDRRCITAFHCGHPEHDDIDAAIRDAIAAQRARDAPGCMFRVPWLHPRAHAGFEIGHDLGGDFLIDGLFHGRPLTP